MKSTGYIGEDGKYHKGNDKNIFNDVNQTYKEWHHDLERKQFSKEIIQPHRYGRPNPDFVKSYPDIAKEYFNEEQIKKAEREL